MANGSGSFWDGQSGNSTSSGSTGSPFGSPGSTPSPSRPSRPSPRHPTPTPTPAPSPSPTPASSSTSTSTSPAQAVHLSPISIAIGFVASYTYCWLSYLFIRQFGLRQLAEQSELDAAYSKFFTMINHPMGIETLFGGTVVLISFLLAYLSVLSLPLMYRGLSKLLCYLLTLNIIGIVTTWFLYLRLLRFVEVETQRMWDTVSEIAIFSAVWTLIMVAACMCARRAEKSQHIWSAVILWVLEAVLMVAYVFFYSLLALGFMD